MANYEVGNLQIAFKAIDDTSASFKDLIKNLNAVKRAINGISNVDISRFSESIKNITKDFSPLLSQIEKATMGLTAFAYIVEKVGLNNLSKVENEFTEIKEDVENLNDGTKKLNDGLEDVGKKSSSFDKLRDKIKKTIDAIRRLHEEQQNINEDLDENEKATKKSAGGFSKPLKSIGRITFYRAIRRAIQLLTQSVSQTFQEFAKVDDVFNNTMSSVTSSLKVMQLSFGTLFIPLLQAIEPILSQLAVGFADFANTISQAMADGESYWAINAEAIQDYREQLEKTTGTLASFDKINSLNAKDPKSPFLEKREVDKENESVKSLGKTIESVKKIISSLWSSIEVAWKNIVKPILEAIEPYIGDIAFAISKVIELVGKCTKKFEELGLIKPTLITIAVLIGALYVPKIISGIGTLISKFNSLYLAIAAVGLAIGLITNWDDFSKETRKAITVISLLVGILTTAALAALALNSALTFGTGAILAITALSSAAVLMKSVISGGRNLSKGVKTFADGGLPDKGTLFYAGEAGAEMVYNTPSGQSGVANLSQIQQAMYNALVQYGRDSGGSDGAININIDGQRVFEATRRVANRKGLDFSRV